jgi:hypothetical protein
MGSRAKLLQIAAKLLHQPEYPDLGRTGIEFENGSGTEIRTPNLAVNRSAQPVQKTRFEFAECRWVPPDVTVCHRRCCTTDRLASRPAQMESRLSIPGK